jgi:hypothetical protein
MWRGLLAGVTGGVLVLAAVFVLVDRMAVNEQAAKRRALITRNAALTAQALAPGSALACLEAEGADLVKSCELSLFATPSSAAAAMGFVAERLKLLEAAQRLEPNSRNQVLAAMAPERRALARDRFGLVAHVLASGYGCTAESCAPLALLGDTGTVKADLTSRPFDALIARSARVWDKVPDETPVASVPRVTPEAKAEAPAAAVAAPESAAVARAESPAGGPHPLDPKWKLPSSDSIPAISIMTPEPKLPKSETKSEIKAEQKGAEQQPSDTPPLPPKRPQAQAAPAPEAR